MWEFNISVKIKANSEVNAKYKLYDALYKWKEAINKVAKLEKEIRELRWQTVTKQSWNVVWISVSDLWIGNDLGNINEYETNLQIKNYAKIVEKYKETNETLKALYKKEKELSKKLKGSVVWLFVSLMLVFMLGIYLLMWSVTIMVNGRSMEPTIMNWDEIIVDKLLYSIFPEFLWGGVDRNDIIVFSYNWDFVIKRIIAKWWDKVNVKNDSITVHNKEWKRVFEVKQDTQINEYTIEIADNEYFVIWDNLPSSEDSRRIWPIKSEDIVWKYVFIIPFK